MFCGNCGTPNNETATFCANCGAPLTPHPPVPETRAPEAPTPAAPTPPAPKPRRSMNWLIILSVIGMAVVLLVVALILALGGNNKPGAQQPEDIATQYLDCFLDADIHAMLDIMPEEVKDETFHALNTPEDWADRMSQGLEEMFDEMDAKYDRWDIGYKIDEVSDLDADDLEDLREFYEDRYDCQVDACKEITVDVTILLDGYEEEEELAVYIIQVDGKWYVEMNDSDDLFSLIMEILYY